MRTHARLRPAQCVTAGALCSRHTLAGAVRSLCSCLSTQDHMATKLLKRSMRMKRNGSGRTMQKSPSSNRVNRRGRKDWTQMPVEATRACTLWRGLIGLVFFVRYAIPDSHLLFLHSQSTSPDSQQRLVRPTNPSKPFVQWDR